MHASLLLKHPLLLYKKSKHLAHTEGRLHDREITSDFPGKIKGEGSVGHAFEQPTDPKKHEADNFAHRIAQYLEEAHNANKFEQLLIIAEPSFLGYAAQPVTGTD